MLEETDPAEGSVPAMRVVVIGTSGAGKSTFAAALHGAAQIPHIELDALYWGPGWTAVPHHQFESAVLAATDMHAWVADGNYSAVRDVLWARATHIVWLNYPAAAIARRLLWRTLRRGLLRTPLWQGNRESLRMAFFSRDSILLWAYSTFGKNRRRYSALRRDLRYAHLDWQEITHPSQAVRWIESHRRPPKSPDRTA